MNTISSIKNILIPCMIVIIIFSCTCSAPEKNRRLRICGSAVASWYGPKFHGRKTASGEVFNMHALTCAHKTLPLGTWIKIKNKNNEKTVTVRVNDRGPFVKGRDFDLSYGAAKKIDMLNEGVAPVYFECIEFGDYSITSQQEMTSSNFYSIQIGSFTRRELAEQLKQSFNSRYTTICISTIVHDSTQFHRVRLGRFTSRLEADQDLKKLISQGYSGFVVSCNELEDCS